MEIYLVGISLVKGRNFFFELSTPPPFPHYPSPPTPDSSQTLHMYHHKARATSNPPPPPQTKFSPPTTPLLQRIPLHGPKYSTLT